MKKQKRKLERILILIVLALVFNLNLVFAEAIFKVTSFSCSPSETVINDAFSCTAQIKNTGLSDGSVGTATLYPDSNNWLENSNYPQSSGTIVSPEQSTSITFSGLRAIKSGNNGFSKIMLDIVTDTYVVDTNKKVNVINAAVSVSNSASSAAMGGSITATSEVTAGGNIDVSLTFVASSGGCSIGSQTNPKTISGMTDGSKQSRTWTITQGTSGNCAYSISAAATGTGGVASKIDSSSSTITCTDCVTTTSSSSSGGAGAGGAGGSKIYLLGELSSAQMVEVGNNERIKFNISGSEHIATLINVSETTAKITIESKKQTFTLNLGEEIKVDLNEDNNADISVKLKSVNIVNKKASIVLERISGGVPSTPESVEETGGVQENLGGVEKGEKKVVNTNNFLWIIIAIFVIIAIISITYYIIQKRKNNIWR